MKSELNVKVKNDERDIHIFYSSSYYPSFFEFQGYKVGNYSEFDVNDWKYFTVFCPSENGCDFKVDIDSDKDSNDIYAVIIICCSIGGVLLLFLIFAAIKRSRYLIYRSEVLRAPVEPSNIEQSGVNRDQELYQNKEKDTNEIIQGIDDYAPFYEPKNESESCSICLNGFVIKEEIRRLKNCLHLFHSQCLLEWLIVKAYCPNCNSKIE